MFVPVKINLGLRVLRRRPDGFHDIETLFVPYSGMGDELTLTPSGQTTIEIVGPEVDWDAQQDLTIQAWRLLKSDFPALTPVHIRLEKHSPVGAGLGGGSADAAFTLRELNRMGGLDLSPDELALYASRLGSDCAFFIYNTPMIGEGRGERLTPFDLHLPYEIRVAVPAGVSVSTREAYSGVLSRKTEVGLPLREALERPVSEWKDVLVNDFEATVFPQHPQIAALKRRFYDEGAVYASMSGSGSAVFGLFPQEL